MEQVTKLKPGDIILEYRNNWKDVKGIMRFFQWAVDKIVVATQRRVLGKNSDYLPVHAITYMGNGNVWSCEPPKPLIKKLDLTDTSVYYKAFRCREYEGIDVTPYLHTAVNKILSYDKPYNVGELADILINADLFGEPDEYKFRLFDFGRHSFVCSAGCMVIGESIRHQLKKIGIELHRWFMRGNKKWTIKEVEPAMYSNSGLFNNEFMEVT